MSAADVIGGKRVRVLITGISGFLGGHLLATVPASVSAMGCFGHRPVHAPHLATAALELADPVQIDRVLDTFRPDAVVHAAAIASVAACEKDPASARRINTAAARHLSRRCRQSGIYLIYISTDMVFDGKKGAAYRESDVPAPNTVYGRTKQAAETAVLADGGTVTVLRPALMIGRPLGPAQTGFLYWMRQTAASGARVPLFSDQYRSPVFVGDVCRIIWHLVARPLPGLFHLGGPECMTRVAMGERFLPEIGLSPSVIHPVRIADLNLGYAVQRNLCLDSSAIGAAVKMPWTPFDRAVRLSLASDPVSG